jgi:HEPN domain-containing protein
LLWKEKLLSLSEFGEEIEPQVSLSRYPGFNGEGLWIPAEEYKNEDVKGLIEKAEFAVKIALGFIDWWFKR